MSAAITTPSPFDALEDDVAQRQLDETLAEMKARHRTPRDARWIERDVRADAADEPTPAARALAYLDGLVPATMAEVAEAAQTIVEALSHERLPGEPVYTVQEVVGWVQRAVDHGCALPRLSGFELERVWKGDLIPNDRLRAAYLEQADEGEGLVSAMAYAAGFTRNGGKADTTRVLRALGVEPSSPKGDNPPTLSIFIACEHAAHFADVLALDYHDLGL